MESYCCLLLVTAQTSYALSSFLWLRYLPAAERKPLPEQLYVVVVLLMPNMRVFEMPSF